jgi:hypothetical protein
VSDHTPTPWMLGGKASIKSQRRGYATDYIATLEQGRDRAANAEFIVRAVNNFDDLIAALKEGIDALGYVLGCDIGDPARHKANTAFTRIETAIAKAEGRS